MKYTYTHTIQFKDKKTGLCTMTFGYNSDDEYFEIMDNINSELFEINWEYKDEKRI